MRVQIDGQESDPYQSWMKESSKRIKDSGDDQMIFSMYPFADLMIHLIQLPQNYHFISQLLLFICQFYNFYQQIMGQKEASSIKQENIAENQSTLDHPRFTKAKLYNHKNGQYIQIQVPIVSQSQILNWQKNFKPMVEYECLLLPLSFQIKKTQFCGSSGLSKIKYDNYPYILKKQIEDRGKEPIKQFQNHYLWYLAYNLLESASVFHTMKEKVGDIRPLNVFINQDGQIKIGNQYSWPQEITNYQKSLHQKQITFLAPEEIKNIHFGSQEIKDIEMAESFSIGLTLLDSVNLTNSEDLYNVGNYRMDYVKLEERRANIRVNNQLEDLLKLVIIGLTAANVSQRLRCSEVYAYLSPYKENILNMESFQCKEPPAWLKSNALIGKSPLVSNRPAKEIPFYTENVVNYKVPNVMHYEKINTQYKSIPINSTNIVQQRVVYPNPPVITRQSHQEIKPNTFQYVIPQAKSPIKIEINQNEVYESSYIPVPPQYPVPNGLRSDDFKSTLTKIQEQLQASRKLFPN